MNNDIITNNQVTISGKIASGFNFSHEIFGEKFYIVNVNVQRLSNTCDTIPVTVSDIFVDVSKDYMGQFVSVTGNFRSYNKRDEEKKHLVLSVFAQEFDLLGENVEINNDNHIILDGYICKGPIYRKTPMGREIADLLLAVNRPYGKSDYIPCICWGRYARFATRLKVGKRIKVFGRVQSRNYIKRYEDGREEDCTAYEVSASRIDVVVVNENQNTEE